MYCRHFLLSLAVVSLLHPQVAADDASASATVKRGPLRVEVNVDALVEAENVHEISVDTKEWGVLRVREAAEHGARVRKGEIVLQLETDDLDEAIADLEAAIAAESIALRQLEIDTAVAAAALDDELAAVDRTHEHALADRERYVRIDRPLSKKIAEFALEAAQSSLEYQKEELKQLEQMYNADELTEESEEIVLKRQRDAVRRAVFALERAKTAFDRTMNIDIPRRDVDVETSTSAAVRAWERSKKSLPLTTEKAELALKAARESARKTAQRLQRLRADRDKLTLRAPADGVVYYGRCVRGAWSPAATTAAKAAARWFLGAELGCAVDRRTEATRPAR